jgi:hypothetical protein
MKHIIYLFLLCLHVFVIMAGCQNPVEKTIEIKTNDDFSIYPRPRLPVIINNEVLGFYNHGFNNFLFFNTNSGEPIKRIDIDEFLLKDLYEVIYNNRKDSIKIIPFDSLYYNNPDAFKRKLSSYGLYTSLEGDLFSILQVPFQYIDKSYIVDGESFRAKVNMTDYFVIFFNDNLEVSDFYYINLNNLPDKTWLYFPTNILMHNKTIVAPIIISSGDFNSFGNNVPGYSILRIDNNEYVVTENKHVYAKKYFRSIGNISSFMSFFYSSSESKDFVYFSCGNEVRKFNLIRNELSDEIVFKDDDCERISYIKWFNGTFYYVCGDFIFNEKPDYLMQVKTSKNKVFSEINPIYSVNPFYDDKHLYFIETDDGFNKTIVKVKKLR